MNFSTAISKSCESLDISGRLDKLKFSRLSLFIWSVQDTASGLSLINVSWWNIVRVCWCSSSIILTTAFSWRSDLTILTQSNSSLNFFTPLEYSLWCSSSLLKDLLFRFDIFASAECGVVYIFKTIAVLPSPRNFVFYLVYQFLVFKF